MFGVVAIIVGIMMMIKREDGTPLLNFYKAAAKIGWDPVLLLAFIIPLEKINVSLTLLKVLI